MKPLDLELERFSHTGGIDGDGASRLLGRPKLEPVPLLVREAVQNSWDSRINDSEPVHFDMHLASLTPGQMVAMRDFAFSTIPAGHRKLREWLDHSKTHQMLWISDRGTVGLRGPTRADVVDDLGQRNFADLVRNLGRDQTLGVGGGTYGYGKSALFRASLCSTVIFYTKIKSGKRFESRLMAGSWIGRMAETRGGKKIPLTGRMWWGRRSDDGITDPLLDDEADRAAGLIGATPFAKGTTGTTIGILAPDLNGMSDADAVREIAASILWHCWPKMVDLGEGPRMHFVVRQNNIPFEIPSLDHTPPLNGYANALRLAFSKEPVREQGTRLATDIFRLRPHTRLGRLGLVVMPRRQRPPELQSAVEPHPAAKVSHHIALMRQPQLVVAYLPHDELPSDMIEYGAVFVADSALERAFADSEPPSHDDWRPELLHDDDARSCVKMTIRRIHEQVDDFLAPPEAQDGEARAIGLGAFSMMVGGLVAGIPGGGAEIPPDPPGGGGGGGGAGGTNISKGRLIVHAATLKREGRQLIVLVPFDATPASGKTEMRVSAEVHVGVMDGAASETDPPLGAAVPEILGWLDPENHLEVSGSHAKISRSRAGRWHLKVAVPDDVQIIANIRAVS